jgi:protein-tyrosine phosphatase
VTDNFSWVIDGLLAGAALPGSRWVSSGDYLRADLADLHDRGVRVLVSLLDVPEALGRHCRRLGIEWISHPIENWGVPRDPAAFGLLVEGILARIDAGLPVCAHCFAGIGRTGLVLCCALGRRFGLDGEQAIRRVRSVRPALETTEQERFVQRYLQHWRGSSGAPIQL